MVYSFTSALVENFSITTEDRNGGRSLGNHDDVACITYSRYDLGGTVDPLTISKLTPTVTKFEERKAY